MDEGTDAKKACAAESTLHCFGTSEAKPTSKGTWEGDVQEFSVKTKRLEITTQI